MNRSIINVKQIINNNFAVSTETGEELFKEIKPILDNGDTAVLDFEGIVILITAFLNASIAPLYDHLYDDSFVDEHLEFINLTPTSKYNIELVIETAKNYFKNQQQFDQNSDDLLNG